MADARLTRPLAWLVILSAAIFAGCNDEETAGTQRVEIKGETFTLELAMTPDARFQGLSGREEIAADGGMMFVFPAERELQFVMRDCLVPIDIIFLGPGGKVLAAHAMQVEPAHTPENELKRYGSNGKSPVAIELAGGSIERLGVEVGEVMDLPIRELKRRAR